MCVSAVRITTARAHHVNELRLQGTYLSGGLITQPHEWRNMSLFVGLIALSIGGTLSYTKLTDARKQRRHKRALADLSKDQ